MPEMRQFKSYPEGQEPRCGQPQSCRRGYPVWLYIPEKLVEVLPSVPERQASNSVFVSPSPEPVLFVTSSGTVTPRPLSWRGWRKRPYIRLLSGTILPPSTAKRGAARFISSLPDILVKPFSYAGKRKGESDPRHLWPHVRRILEETAAPLIFCENVPGHLSCGFDQVVQDLEAMDYGVKAIVVSAARSRRKPIA